MGTTGHDDGGKNSWPDLAFFQSPHPHNHLISFKFVPNPKVFYLYWRTRKPYRRWPKRSLWRGRLHNLQNRPFLVRTLPLANDKKNLLNNTTNDGSAFFPWKAVASNTCWCGKSNRSNKDINECEKCKSSRGVAKSTCISSSCSRVSPIGSCPLLVSFEEITNSRNSQANNAIPNYWVSK